LSVLSLLYLLSQQFKENEKQEICISKDVSKKETFEIIIKKYSFILTESIKNITTNIYQGIFYIIG
jgi:hypothetical protein